MIKRNVRPKRQSTHMQLVKECDSWVRAIIMNRQGVHCLKCNDVKPLHAAHILSKGAHPGLRHDLENVIGLCMKCHIFWSHRDPVGFTDWIEENFPGRISRLKASSLHYRKNDLKELACVLKAIYEQELNTPYSSAAHF